MALVEDDDVIQTLAVNRAYNSLDESVLPRSSRHADNLGDSHSLDSVTKIGAVRRVMVAQQIARSSVPWKRFGYLAGEPSCGGMLGDGRVNDPPAIVGQNDRHVKQPKRHRCHNEHIDRGNAGGVVEQKAAPGRRGCTSSSHHVFGDRSLVDLDAEP